MLVLQKKVGTLNVDTNLLVHSNTTDGSTTFVDSSSGGLTLTPTGDVQHTTSEAKFGSSSIQFPTINAGSIQTVENSGFAVGTGDFTIDMWVYRQNAFNTEGLFSCLGYTAQPQGNIDGPAILTSVSFPSNVYAYIGNNGSFEGGYLIGSVPLNTWTHIAFMREGNVRRTAFNGVVTTIAGLSSRNCTVRYASIGARYYDGSNPLTGDTLLDEVRFSKAAEWSTNFTPPTSPY